MQLTGSKNGDVTLGGAAQSCGFGLNFHSHSHILIILIILLILIFFIIVYHEYLDYPQGLENEQQGPFEGSGDNLEDAKLTMIIS